MVMVNFKQISTKALVDLMKKLQHTPTTAARFFGTHERNVLRWFSGESRVPVGVEGIVRGLSAAVAMHGDHKPWLMSEIRNSEDVATLLIRLFNMVVDQKETISGLNEEITELRQTNAGAQQHRDGDPMPPWAAELDRRLRVLEANAG